MHHSITQFLGQHVQKLSFNSMIYFFPSLAAEILGALLSVCTIWVVTGVLVYLAVERLINDDYEIEGTLMLITSGCAVLANIM